MNWLTKRNDRPQQPRIGTLSVNLKSYAGDRSIPGIDRRIDPEIIYGVALPRILAFLDELQVRATIFVVGKDIEDPQTHPMLQDAVARGHEIASMSYAHAPNLRLWSKLSVAEDIERSGRAIKNAVGIMPTGFRTPGFNVDTRILQLLAERGYTYDASVLPSLPYYLIKGGISSLGAFIRGKRDASYLAVHSLKAPLHPYRPSRWAFWEAGDRKHSLPIWEIPVGVVRGVGAPLTGALITSTQPALVRPLARALKGKEHSAHLTLHATDFLDANDVTPSGAFARMRTNMQQSHSRKMKRLRTYIEEMKRDARVLPLKELAELLDAQAGPTVVG